MLRYTTDRARPGLVAFYDIRPGNRAGQFLQPRSPHGATVPYGEGILPPSTEASSGPKQHPELTFRKLIGKHTQSIAHVYIQTNAQMSSQIYHHHHLSHWWISACDVRMIQN